MVIDDASDAAQFSVDDFVRIENEFSNRIDEKQDLGGGRTRFTLSRAAVNAYAAGWSLHKLAFGRSVNEVRHTFDGVFDQGIRAQDALVAVARTARGMPVLIGNQIRMRWTAQRSPVQITS